MSQQHPMQMGGMGGPVGPPVANAGTPNSAGLTLDGINKKLNTAIYDYLLCNEKYDVARAFHKEMQIEIAESGIKQSPNQRGNQPNGVNSDMDVDGKEHHGIRQRPSDLPAPQSLSSEDSPFLQDWWCQFWELYQGNRQKGKPTTLSYVGQQRQQMKQRAGLVTGVDPSSMRPGYNMMNNGMGGDLRQAAMKNGMTQQAMAAQMKMQQQRPAGQMQGGNQMERQGSQMNMSDPRSGSPNTGGDAPSPKRQRLDGAGNMQQMNQARGGQQPQMQGSNQVGPSSSIPPQSSSFPAETLELLARRNIDPNSVSQEQLQKMSAQTTNVQAKSVEVYSQAMQQQMHSAIQRASSNPNKGMPQNPAIGPGGAQSSPMNQENFNANGEMYSGNARMGMPPQNGAAAAGGQQGANNGNHALQDYQMQLMLLEQQNKKRLLMARQEQDSMAHPTGVPGPNGGKSAPEMSPPGNHTWFPPIPNGMQRIVKLAGLSPNGDMTGRGSPQPGMMDPSNPAMRPQMMMGGPNGAPMMRPPSSHPMSGQQMTPQQMEMLRQQQGQMMPNGANWQQGGPQPPGQMMPGQQPGQPGPPGQPPNMTPRQGNMPPPPAPANAAQGGTQPSSPAQPPAPPTPSQANKAKPGNKKAADNKKGPAAAKKDENAPPTPTPPPPVTPSNQASFNQNKNVPGMPNGQPNPGQQQNQPNAGQPPADMNMPFGAIDDNQFGSMDFANIDSGDVLDNFDFDSFLNNTGGDEGLGFDANFAFGDGGIETDIGGN